MVVQLTNSFAVVTPPGAIKASPWGSNITEQTPWDLGPTVAWVAASRKEGESMLKVQVQAVGKQFLNGMSDATPPTVYMDMSRWD